MGLIDSLKADADANCALRLRDRVILAGSNETGVIVEDGGYGYFKVKLDSSGKRVIRRFSGLALLPLARTEAERAMNRRVSTLIMRGLDASEAAAQAAREAGA